MNGDRSAILKKNIYLSFIVKGWSILVQLLLVPMTLKCLGTYQNGIWMTIASMLLWIDSMDIGLGNGLRNQLATFMAQKNIQKAKEAVSSTFFMLIMIISPIAIILISLAHIIDCYALLNVNPSIVKDLVNAITVSIIFVCSTFIFKFIGNFYLGMQMPAINNLLVTSGNTIALIGTFLAYKWGWHSLMSIAIINTASPLVCYLASYPITFNIFYPKLRPSYLSVKYQSAKSLFTTGINFFVLQIAGVVLLMSSNILISKLFSPSMVTPYQIAYRYFTVLLMIFTIICVPYWTATTDAYTKGDFRWIKNANKTLNRIIAVVFLLTIILIAISDWVYSVWIRGQVHIPLAMTVIVGIYMFILVVSTRYSYILNGLGALRVQLIFTITAAGIFIPLSYLVVSLTHNLYCFLGVMCLVNIPGLIANAIQYHKIINNNAHGFWEIK